MNAEVPFEATAVVRSYSFEVEQRLGEGIGARHLSQSLVEQRNGGHLEDITSPWRSFFEASNSSSSLRNPATEIVQDEAMKLRDKWVAFYQKSSKAERLDLRNFQPTMSGVVTMVTKITSEWQTKRHEGRVGKTKKLFHRFCGTLDSHSSLMKILPEGNEYVAIFAGTLNAIIKASANHEKIAEGLAEGLCTISEHIEDTDRDLKLSKSDDMLHLVADLYEHVFLFLSSVMDWIMEKRFRRLLDSFSDNFNERFENEIRRINKKAERIRTFATQSLTAEARVTRLLVEGLDRDMRLGLDGDKRHRADMQLFAERIERQLLKVEESRRVQDENMRKLGGAVVVLLETDASKWLENHRLSPILLRSTGERPESPSRHMSYTDESPIGIEDVIINSRHLEDYFCRSRGRLSPDEFGPMAGGEEAVTRLSEWSQGFHPPMLWFEGPTLEVDDFENPLTSIAAKFVGMVAAHQLNVISYFCEVPRASAGHDTPEAEGAIRLLYALLRQLVEKLPPRLDTAVDLSEARFAKLDGSMSNWTEAIELLGDLLSVLSGVVFCVIDGFHWLDGEGTDAPLAQLLTALRHDRLRVFFTTCGRSGCLLDYLERDEIFIMGGLTMLRDAPYDFDTK